MVTREVTYRIGQNMHLPKRKMGNEIRETISVSFLDWLDSTEIQLGKKISVVSLETFFRNQR